MSKKLLSILLTVCMLLSMLPMTLFVSAEEVEDVVEDVVFETLADEVTEIGTADELIALMNDSSKWAGNFKLTADIDLTGLTGQAPIGNKTTQFTGTFDGAGHTIRGINIVGTEDTRVALFGGTFGATIENLTIYGTISGGAQGTAGFVGLSDFFLTIRNCVNYCDITSTSSYTGGIAGYVRTNHSNSVIIIENCKNYGTINGTSYTGGIVGYTQIASTSAAATSSITVSECANYGLVKTESTSARYVGGIAGLATSRGANCIIFERCLNAGNVNSAYRDVGGIVAYLHVIVANGVIFNDCMNAGDIYGTGYVGGLFGYHDATNKYKSVTTNFYNCGNISAASGANAAYVMPITGVPRQSTFANAYYLEDGITDSRGTAVTAEQSVLASTFTGFDSDTWVINKNGPELKVFHTHDFSDGEFESTGIKTHAPVCYCGELGDDVAHADDDNNKVCDICDGVMECDHGDTVKTWETVSVSTCAVAGSEQERCECGELTGNTRVSELNEDAHVNLNYVWSKNEETGAYEILCPDCNAAIASQTDKPTVYLTPTSITQDGFTRETGMHSLPDAVEKIAATGGTVWITERYTISGLKITLPEYTETITIRGDLAENGVASSGFFNNTSAYLYLGGPTVFDNIVFRGVGTTADTNKAITYIVANWNDLTMEYIRNYDNSQAYVVAGNYYITESNDEAKEVTINLAGASKVSGTTNNFYARVYLGDVFDANGISSSNKTVTLNVKKGLNHEAVIDLLYTMSTSGQTGNYDCPTPGCETTVNLYDGTSILRGRTGDRNTGYSNSTAYMDKLTVNMYDNSTLGGTYQVRNVAETVVNVSTEADGRTVAIPYQFATLKMGVFANVPSTVTVTADSHGFKGAALARVSDAEDQVGDPAPVFTFNVTDVCTWDDGVIDPPATPEADGVITYTCTVCGKTKTDSVEFACVDHIYVVDADGNYTCANGCEVEAPVADTVVSIAPTTTNGETVDVYVSFKSETPIIAAGFEVNAPEGFTLTSYENLVGESTAESTDWTLTVQDAVEVPFTAALFNMAVADATFDAQVLKLTFAIDESVEYGDYVFTVVSTETYNYDEEAIDTVAVSAKVTVAEFAPVAQIGDVKYATLADAVAEAKDGDVVELLSDITVEAPTVITEDITLDLGGNTITAEVVYPVIRIQDNATVTVKNGNIVNGDYVFVLGASDSSSAGNLIIESGSYKGDVTVASVTMGTLTVNGGRFEAAPYNGSYDFTLNCIDANYRNGTASIVVNGGEFVGFNPADNAAEGADTSFVAEGYDAVEADGVWTVVPHEHAYAAEVTAPTCTEKGYTTYTCACGDEYVDDYVDELGHAWDDGVIDPPAKPGEVGIITYTCKNGCGETYTEEIPALDAVAQIGDVKYETLADAFEAAEEGDTIVALAKITVSGTEVWDLTGKTLVLAEVEDNYGLVVKGDLTIEGGNFVTGTYGIGVTGTLTVNDGAFSTEKDGYLIGSWGETTINGGEFDAVYCNVNGFAGTLTIGGGDFAVAGYTGEYDSADVLAGENVATIYGGTFSTDPSDYVADGFKAEEVDGVYGIVACDYVAEVNGVKYETLADAFEAAEEGDTIVALAKITVSGTEVWDLTGKTLVLAEVEDNYALVVKGDLTIEGGNFVTGTYGIGVTGTLTVNDGAFSTEKDGYLIGSWGETTINGGEFDAVYCNVNGFAGTLTIGGGDFAVAGYTGEYDSADVLAGENVATIYGGTFSTDPSDYVAEGYQAVEVDGVYGIVECDYVAEVNGVKYETLADAFEAAEEGDTIVALAKITVSGTEVWDLTGKTLVLAEVEDNYGLVVKGDLTIEGGNFVAGTYGIGVQPSGTLTINDGTFSTEKDYYLIGSWGETTINGGEFDAVYCNVNGFAGTLKINGGDFTVTGTDEEYPSSDVFAEEGVATIYGGTFSTDPSDYVAEGYQAVEVDGVYGIEEIPEHVHEYVETFTAATRETDAYFTYTCECDYSYDVVVETGSIDRTFTRSVALGSDYKVFFRIAQSAVDAEDFWMEVSAYNYVDGEKVVTTKTVEPVVNGTSYEFVSPGISSKQMNDQITWTFYEIVDGYKYATAANSFNLVSYYEAVLVQYENAPNQVFKNMYGKVITLLKEIFNYGANAQTYFTYNTVEEEGNAYSGLVNKHIPEADRKLGLDAYAGVEYGATRIEGNEAGKAFTFKSNAANLEQQIVFTLDFTYAAGTTVDDSLVFKGSYLNTADEEVTIEITGDKFTVTESSKTVRVSIDTIYSKDLRAMITGAIYDAEGNQVSETITTSFECYATSYLNMNTTIPAIVNLKPLLLSTLAYADAAATYFAK